MHQLLQEAIASLPSKLGEDAWLDETGCPCTGEHLHGILVKHKLCRCDRAIEDSKEADVNKIGCIAYSFGVRPKQVDQLIDLNDLTPPSKRNEVVHARLVAWLAKMPPQLKAA